MNSSFSLAKSFSCAVLTQWKYLYSINNKGCNVLTTRRSYHVLFIHCMNILSIDKSINLFTTLHDSILIEIHKNSNSFLSRFDIMKHYYWCIFNRFTSSVCYLWTNERMWLDSKKTYLNYESSSWKVYDNRRYEISFVIRRKTVKIKEKSKI